ncbi:MAG: ethylbenzene dehydrogenase-related protein [bacterium]
MGDKSKITIFYLGALVFLLVFFGCGKDESGPTPPTVNLKDQVFSIAVGNGDNTLHTGAKTVLLDWNNDSTLVSAGLQKLPVIHVNQNLPVIDGKADDKAWQEAQWTPITLELIDDGVKQDTPKTSGTPITEIRVKAVFNKQFKKVCFLLQWTDPDKDPVYYEPHFWKNYWLYDENETNNPWYFWIGNVDSDSDWVSFMFDTWKWHYNSEGKRDDLKPMSKSFQEKGCEATCHNTGRPYHLNGKMTDPYENVEVSEITDLWVWDATFTNFGGLSEEPEKSNPPGYVHDGFIDSENGVYGDRNDLNEKDNEGLRPALDKSYFDFQSDEGTPGYQKNSVTLTGGNSYRPEWISKDYFIPTNDEQSNPWARPPYIWISDAFNYSNHFQEVNWKTGVSILSGFANRNALGGGADVSGVGVFDPKTNLWTLEIARDLEAKSNQDTDFYIYDPHDFAPE